MKYFNCVKKFGTKLAVGTVGSIGLVATASADGDGGEAVFTALGAKATAYEGYAWGLLAIVMTAIISIKLFKKFTSKAV